MKRAMRKAHNIFLWVVTVTMFVVLLISAAATEIYWTTTISFFVALAWLLVFALVNEKRWV